MVLETRRETLQVEVKSFVVVLDGSHFKQLLRYLRTHTKEKKKTYGLGILTNVKEWHLVFYTRILDHLWLIAKASQPFVILHSWRIIEGEQWQLAKVQIILARILDVFWTKNRVSRLLQEIVLYRQEAAGEAIAKHI